MVRSRPCCLLLSPIKPFPVLGDSGLLAGDLLLAGTKASTNHHKHNREHEHEHTHESRRRDEFWRRLGVPTDRPIVAVNYGTNTAEPAIYHSRQGVLRDVFVAAVRALANRGYTVVLYAMYGNDHAATRELFNLAKAAVFGEDEYDNGEFDELDTYSAGAGAGEEHAGMTAADLDRAARGNRLHWVPKLPDTRGLLGLLRASDLSLNYKLHGSILSASVGTPFVAVAYHFKAFDFLDSLGEADFGAAREMLVVRSDALQALGPVAGAERLCQMIRRPEQGWRCWRG